VHEYSIVAALLNQVATQAAARGAKRVARVWVRIGELSGVEPDLLRTAYETFRARTVCDDAPLEIDAAPAVWACRRCGRSPGRGEALRCDACGIPASLVSGDEIILSRIEMEVADV
jgi:hydrogenase nickel incorporation protein HypA/HybF